MSGLDAQMNDDNDNEATQLASQQVQEASQQVTANAHLWGALIPTSPTLSRLDFWRGEPSYTFGRHNSCSYVLRSPKISNVHCTITWRGGEPDGDPAEVLVYDSSTNGTYINGVRIGKGSHRLLEQGNELSFGAAQESSPEHDHRYMYRHFANPENKLGDFFDSYQLSSELGRGAFASVRRAVGVKDGQMYAVKIIQQRRFDAGHTRMFEREMQILRSLNHPNVVQCFDIFPDPSTIFIVMEFVNGGDMLELILGSGGGLAEDICQSLTRDVCSAMDFLHNAGVVHRDIKPENVLVTTGPPRRAKVADFGLAKIVDSATFLKTQCGTPAYLAPEVVLNETGQYTHTVDSWSVGVMVFSMLTMTVPFDDHDDNNDPVQLRRRIAERRVQWHLTEHKSPEAISWLRGMLDEDPVTRMDMHAALMHPWLYDPYDGGQSNASFYNVGASGAGGEHPQNGTNGGTFGGNRNANGAQAPQDGGANGYSGGGGGHTLSVRQQSSEFIYGAKMSTAQLSSEPEPENREPVPVAPEDVSMALDSPRKRRVTSAMDIVDSSPRKRPYPDAHARRRPAAHI